MQKKWIELALPLGVILCIFVIYLPLPTGVMDLLLAGNITISVVLLLTALFVKSPLELSAFPALLLITTLGRLALNIATTRLILTRGPVDGELAAGEVVRAFSQFVTGDHLLVGAILFAILFVVQFVVITKGATRIGEVAARFALDGLPGRQLAIDADLNAGLIDLKEARARRRELLQQADFHGAMDGASKYVRGDAVAGLVITVINLAAGLILGVAGGLSLGESAEVFSKLTIGDGLVTQLPALLISIAAGLLVSRGTEESNLPRDVVQQLIGNPLVLALAAGFVGLLALTDLPRLPLLGISLGVAGLAVVGRRQQKFAMSGPAQRARSNAEPTAERLLELDVLEIQLGSDLLRLADAGQGGKLLSEVAAIRRQVARARGLLLPKVRVRDNLQLPATSFEVVLQGNKIVRGQVFPDRQFDPHPPKSELTGAVRSQGIPWAGDGLWLAAGSAGDRSETLSAAQVIARCLAWAADVYVREFLSRDAVQQMLEELKRTAPTLAAELVPGTMNLARLQRLLQELLLGGVSLRPLALIGEAIADLGAAGLADWQIIEEVRLRLGRQIAEGLKSPLNSLRCFGLAEDVAIKLRSALSAQTGIDPAEQVRLLPSFLRNNLLRAIESGQRHLLRMQLPPVLKVDQDLRPLMAKLCESMRPDLQVLGSKEVASHCETDLLAEIRWSDLQIEKQAA